MDAPNSDLVFNVAQLLKEPVGSTRKLNLDSPALALDDAVAAGVVVVFSAGNYHALAGGQPTACSPNSIWLYKSRADILAVGTCRLDKTMWDYSSRGPSQHFGSPNTSAKPDVVAPTPRNGRILYGTGESVLANGWGPVEPVRRWQALRRC